MEKHNTAKDFLAALDRLENDALASRDGYGYSSGDAETIRRVLAENEQLRKDRDELARIVLMIEDGAALPVDEDEWNYIVKICREAKKVNENGNA